MISVIDDDGKATRVRLLAPLRFRDFRLLWTGMTLSLLGDGVLLVALAWQAYQLSNRPAAMSLIVLAWLSISGELELWHLVVFAALYGAASAFFMPAFEALVPHLVPEARLAEANALDQFVRPAMLWLLGPALGGVLIGTAGTGWAFAIDAATFGVSAVCLSRMTRIPPKASESLCVGAVLLPYLVKNELGGDARDFGLILAAGGVATLAVAGYGLAHTRWQAMGAAALISTFETLGAVAWVTTKQRLIPGELLGRVSSFDGFISIAMVPVSYAVTAPVAAAIGTRQSDSDRSRCPPSSRHVRLPLRARGT